MALLSGGRSRVNTGPLAGIDHLRRTMSTSINKPGEQRETVASQASIQVESESDDDFVDDEEEKLKGIATNFDKKTCEF